MIYIAVFFIVLVILVCCFFIGLINKYLFR